MSGKVRRTCALVVAVVAMAAGCDGPSDPTEISAEARAYLDAVLDVMQAHSVNRHELDWTLLRAEAFERAGAAQTVADTYRAIERALLLLGDGHSWFRTVEGVTLAASTQPCGGAVAEEPVLPADIGYVRVRPFTGGGSDAQAYMRSIHVGIAAFDSDSVVGWIVDLRGNLGGDLWLMLAGVGPVLGEGVAGYFVDADGAAAAWEYRDGASFLDGVEMRRLSDPYTLISERPRVAVITDNRTISQGEAVAIAFRGRAETRSFGQATCGITTHTSPFDMPDGAVLNLAVAHMADRTGQTYHGFLQPDEVRLGLFEPIERAIDWLRSGDS